MSLSNYFNFDYDFGAILRAERKAQGISMQDLGDSVGLSNQAISQYELGKRALKYSIAETLAKELGHSIPELLVKYNLYNEYIPEHFNGDVEAYIAFQEAVASDALAESAIENSISFAEHELLKKYRALDERGRENIDNTLNFEYQRTKKAPAISEDSLTGIEFDEVMFLDEDGNRMIAPVTPEIKEIAMRALKKHAEAELKSSSVTTDDAHSQ